MEILSEILSRSLRMEVLTVKDLPLDSILTNIEKLIFELDKNYKDIAHKYGNPTSL